MVKLADLAEGAANTDWTAIPGVSITSVIANQRYNPQGKLHDVMDVTFTIDTRPGSFVSHVTADDVWESAAVKGITNQVKHITAIYGLGG